MKSERDIESSEKVVREVFHPDMLGIEVSLKNAPLWKQFHGEGTEMIITKSGRRMFPSLRIGLSGLEPESRYFVLLETSLADCHRYKFTAAEWTVVGGAEPQTHASTRLYVHPDSPATGSSWMAQDVLFHRAKLTNNTLDRSGNLVLTSMHKYQPRIHVIKASDILALHWSPTLTVTFPETEFIAVTAYQNEKITKLKIDNNPFAKGFRETGMAQTKKKTQSASSDDDQRPTKRPMLDDQRSTKRPMLDDDQRLTKRPMLDDQRTTKRPMLDDDVTRSPAPSSPDTKSEPREPSPMTPPKPTSPPKTEPTEDSGVSVGSASPAPLTSPPTSPPLTTTYNPPHFPILSDMPPPPYYPTALWPYQPFSFYHPFTYYPPPFHLPTPPPMFELPPHYPFDFSLKH